MFRKNFRKKKINTKVTNKKFYNINLNGNNNYTYRIYIFVVPSMNTKLIEFNISGKEDIGEILFIATSFWHWR